MTLTTEPFVGRSQQLAELAQRLDALADGVGDAVFVDGEPGIGKSSLARRVAATATAGGYRVLWADCDPLSEDLPLRPLIHALDSDPASPEGSQVAEQMHLSAAAGTRTDLIAVASSQLLEHLEAICRRTPVVLVIDDIQWADTATVITAGQLCRRIPQLPLLLVCLARALPYRRDLAALRRGIPPGGLIRMRGLTATETVALVTATVGGSPSPALMRLAESAAGNPLYLTELLAALLRSGALSTIDNQVHLGSSRIPTTLAEAIADRLDFLTGPTRTLLDAAALLGVKFSVTELATITRRGIRDLQHEIDDALVAGVLRDENDGLAFRHPVIHAGLYQNIPAAARLAWHLANARALSDSGAGINRVARQLLPACDPAQPPPNAWALRWLIDSSQHLAGVAPHATVRLMRWALRAAPAGSDTHDLLSCRLADALYRAGEIVEAAGVALGALIRVTRDDLMVELHSTLTQCRALTGRSQESLVALHKALEDPDLRPVQRARLLVLIARAHRFLGHVDRAATAAGQALAAARDSGDRWAQAWALSVQCITHGVRGEPLAALPLYDQALACCETEASLADLRLLLIVNKSVALGDLDRLDEAVTLAEQARRLAEGSANAVRLSQAQTALAELLFNAGRWDDALAHLHATDTAAKDPISQCVEYGVATTIALHRGDQAATAVLDGIEGGAATHIGDRVVTMFTMARSLRHEHGGAPGQALAVLRACLTDTVEETDEAADLLPDAVRLALRAGEGRIADELTRRAEAITGQIPRRQAIALHCRGLRDGDPAPLLLAARHYQDGGRVLPCAQAFEAAGTLLAPDDAERARTALSTAHALYTRLGAARDLSRLRDTLRRHRIRRAPRVPSTPATGWGGLTPAERSVADLVAEGLTNRQIAQRLYLSHRTVQSHVAKVLAKLGLQNRAEVAREAVRRDTNGSAR